MTMAKEGYIQIGEIYREHGVQGEVKVWVYSQSDENFRKGMKVILRRSDGDESEVQIDAAAPYQKWFLTKFSTFTNPEKAKEWRKAHVLVKKSDLTKARRGEYYLFDLIGCQVVDVHDRPIGTLNGMTGEGESALFVVHGEKGDEILIPAVPEWIEKVDKKGKKIVVKMQEGLI